MKKFPITLFLALLVAGADPTPLFCADAPKTPVTSVPDSAVIYNVRALDAVPRLIKTVAPKYPKELLTVGDKGQVEASNSGEVDMLLYVNEAGVVYGVKVVKSSDTFFEQAAVAAVKQWRFSKATVKGKPVKFKIYQPIKFGPQPSPWDGAM